MAYNDVVALPMSHRIGPAAPGELAEIQALLGVHGLPAEGIDALGETTLVCRSRGRIIGCAALEIAGQVALLRSVAVDPGWQGRGLGADLVEKIEGLARARGVRTLYLLTTSAEGYFPRLGFTRCTRDDVPASLRQSVEFTSLCPAGATVMRKDVPELPPAVRRPRE